MEWRFKELTRNDTLQNASHLEFFHNDALSSAVDALVREDIQNRLDARAKNEPFVEVRYKLCGPCEPSSRERWFFGLAPHLSSHEVRDELNYQPSLDKPLSWLVIEDFHTTGLEGDPQVHQDPPSNQIGLRNDFFWFVRNVGRSGKKGKDRGRWGLGKIVYPASSRIRSFFAYTIRHSDKKEALIGRSVLAVHHSGGTYHDSEGYFGRFDDEEHRYFATPEVLHAKVEKFRSDFSISRLAGEAGLSAVIPWPHEDITNKSLVASVIDHWFWVVLDGRLKIRVTDTAGKEVSINADNIDQVAQSLHGSNPIALKLVERKLGFSRAAQGMNLSGPDFFHLTPYKACNAPKWDASEDRFGNEDNLSKARELFQSGRLIGFDIPVKVCRTDGAINEEASFEVYLQRTEGSHPPVEIFLRDGLCISGQKFLREAGILALVKVEDDALGTMLGDAENPAHTRWERNGKHFHGKYEYGPSILSYVQRSAQNLASFLSRRPEGIDRDLLQELFYLPETGEDKAAQTRKGKGRTKPVIPPLQPRDVFVECVKFESGFRLHRHPKATKSPKFIQVRAAYEVIQGDSFRFHHPADFDFSHPQGIKIEMVGLSVHTALPNRLLLSVESEDFEFKVTRFDPNRDLCIDVKPMHNLTGSGEDQAESETADESSEP